MLLESFHLCCSVSQTLNKQGQMMTVNVASFKLNASLILHILAYLYLMSQ